MSEPTKAVQKDAKVEVEFKTFSELDKKTFNSMPVFNGKHAAVIQKRITSKGFSVCSIKLELHPMVVIEIPIDLNRYNAMLLSLKKSMFDDRGKENLEHFTPVRYRFVKGKNKVGEYKQLELFFNKMFYNSWFITNNPDQSFVFDQLEKSNQLDFEIKWVERPGVLDDTSNPTYELF